MPAKRKTAAEAEAARQKKKADALEAKREAVSDVERPKTLAESLVLAQSLARSVVKSDKNPHHGYKYASTEDIVQECNLALTAAGLAVFPVKYSLSTLIPPSHPRSLVVTYRVQHWTGEHLELYSETSILPGKGRPEDKAEATAKTYDLGYMLRGLLLLPRVEQIAEVDQRDDQHYQPSPPPPSSGDYVKPPPSSAEDVKKAQRLGKANQRLKEIADLKGKDWCRGVMGTRPMNTLEEREDAVALLEYNIAKDGQNPKSKANGGTVSDADVKRYWQAVDAAGFTDSDASADLRELYGVDDPKDLSPENYQAAYKRLLMAVKQQAAVVDKPPTVDSEEDIPY